MGDRLKTEASIELIEAVHGPVDVEIYNKHEDFTSRLDHINRADAILLFGFEIDRTETGVTGYSIAEDLDAVDPPIVPIGSAYRFFPADDAALDRQQFGTATRSFLDRVVSNCPDGRIPIRSNLVGEVLAQNGYDHVLTGDPAWYDPEMHDEPVHRPTEIDQLVFTLPHWRLYEGQAKELIRRLTDRFEGADLVVSRHTTPSTYEQPIVSTAEEHGWEIHYASHDTSNLELYRESDLHVGYRLHGHLAHLRWGRPSVILEEDSRARGLTQTLGTAGVTAYRPRSPAGLGRVGRQFSETLPVRALRMLIYSQGYVDWAPSLRRLAAVPNPDAVDETLEFVDQQLRTGWPAMDQIRDVFEHTYEHGMRPYLERAIPAPASRESPDTNSSEDGTLQRPSS